MSNLLVCVDCSGTGVDQKKQSMYQKTIDYKLQGGIVRCWTCNGKGLDPLEYFNWKTTKEEQK